MMKLGFNFLIVVLLVLVLVFTWRSKRREKWERAGLCTSCGAGLATTDRQRSICADCVLTRKIQWGLAGCMALVAALVAAWLHGSW
jgi:hypothetical protein